jgi:hypothetical protein
MDGNIILLRKPKQRQESNVEIAKRRLDEAQRELRQLLADAGDNVLLFPTELERSRRIRKSR